MTKEKPIVIDIDDAVVTYWRTISDDLMSACVDLTNVGAEAKLIHDKDIIPKSDSLKYGSLDYKGCIEKIQEVSTFIMQMWLQARLRQDQALGFYIRKSDKFKLREIGHTEDSDNFKSIESDSDERQA